jgi:predicted transcriptional regulator
MFDSYDNDVCSNRHNGAETSLEAFEQIRGGITARCAQVLELIREAGPTGLTAEEIADRLDTRVNCISGRVSALAASGEIVRAGRRKTRSGMSAYVNVAAELVADVEMPAEPAELIN